MLKLLELFMASKKLKAGVGAGGVGIGISVLVFALQADVDKKLEKQDQRLQQYVALVAKPIKVEIENLKKNVDDTNQKVNDIHKYLLNKKTNN